MIKYKNLLRIFTVCIFQTCWILIAGSVIASDQKKSFFDNDLQNVIVKGKVTDSNGEPLVGVTIKVKGTSNGVTSDVEGKFSIKVSDASVVLVFSYLGFNPVEKRAGDASVIHVVMQASDQSLEEVVVVGYGTQKKVNLTGSVSTVSAKEIENRPITQASQALAGLAGGVTVTQGAGRPGNDGASIRIRGVGTFSGAGNEPLVLIDGLAASINDIDPNNIQSISVLKDAASASIYGTRAANGVILVETKKGQQGKLQVIYDSYAGWQQVTEMPDFVESATYAALKNEANSNEGRSAAYSEEEIMKFQTGSDPDNYPNVPHLKNLLTSNNGFQTSHTVGFTGGTDKSTFMFSSGYLKQNGIVEKNSYSRYNFLLNFNSQIKDNLALKVNLNGYTGNTDEPRQYEGDMTSIIRFAVREGPVYAGLKSDGTYGYQDNYSPEAWLSSPSFVNRKNRNFLGGAELAWTVVKNLTLSGKAGYKYYNYDDNSYASDFTFNSNKTVGPNNLSVSSGNNNLVTLQALVQYAKATGKHNYTMLGGYSQEEFREDWTSAYRDNFPNNALYELNAGSSSNMQSSGSGSEWALRSFFGRINYSFDQKYLFEANARYDGTSRFPEKGRWGFFPSVSAAWRLSEESYIKDNLSWVNNLKLRLSWGELGNQNIGNYPFQNVLSLGQNYSFGGTLYSGARLTRLANPDITWETTRVANLGLDVSVLGNKLNLVFDYFDKTTSDILYSISVSNVLGLAPSEANAATVKNTGFEVMLNYQTSIRQLNIGLTPNFSYIKNRVTALAGGLQQDINKGLFVGHPINSTYGYEADGLFVDDNDIANYPAQPYSAQPGFVRYKDINGPGGVPDGIVDATYDRKVIGSYFPKFSYGFTMNAEFKGFDFSMLWHGLGGFRRQMGSYQAFAFYNGGQIQTWQAEGRWTEANPDRNAIYPKLTSLNSGAGTIMPSTYWDRNASFIRLKNIQLGYSFSSKLTERMKINKLRLFVSGQNLFSFKHFYQGWDPEMGQSTGDNTPFYPITGIYTFGLNVKF
ncbi:MAG: SusC/RagA family TonB-linked outer membrane protein [Arcticibacter sp.]